MKGDALMTNTLAIRDPNGIRHPLNLVVRVRARVYIDDANVYLEAELADGRLMLLMKKHNTFLFRNGYLPDPKTLPTASTGWGNGGTKLQEFPGSWVIFTPPTLPEGTYILQVEADDKVVWDDYPKGALTGWVKRVAKDGTWAVIEARTGIGATFEAKKYSGPDLMKWQGA